MGDAQINHGFIINKVSHRDGADMYTIFKNGFESSIFIYLSEDDISKLSDIKLNHTRLCPWDKTNRDPLIVMPCNEKLK